MKSSSNGGDRAPPGHLLSPSETFSPCIGLNLIKLLAKGVTWESPSNPEYCQDYVILHQRTLRLNRQHQQIARYKINVQ